MSLGTITASFALLNGNGGNYIRSDSRAFSAVFTALYEADIAVTATPAATVINNVIGASPVTLFIFNPNTVAATVLGVAGFTQSIPAGQGVFIPAFVTTSNLTLSLASGTGFLYVLLLK